MVSASSESSHEFCSQFSSICLSTFSLFKPWVVVIGLQVVSTGLPDHSWSFQVQISRIIPPIFSPNNAQHLCPWYLHHKKPIKVSEFRGKFHFCTLQPKKPLAVWSASTWLKVSHPFLTEYNTTTKFGNWTSRNNKKFGTVALPGDIVGVWYLLLQYAVEMTLQVHLRSSLLFCHSASNNLDKCALVLRFCYENILNGQKFHCVMNFSCFFAEKSF